MGNFRLKTDSFFFLVLCISGGHFIVDFMLSIWAVYKTMVHLDLATASIVAAVAIASGEMMQLLFGKFIDQGYQRHLLIIGPVLASASALFPYGSESFHFLFILFITAVGSAAFHPTAASILGSIESSKKFMLLGIFQASGMIGLGVGQLFFTQTFFIFNGHTSILAIPAILLAFIVFGLVHSQLKKNPSGKKDSVSIKLVFKFFHQKYLRYLYFVQLGHQTIFWAVIFLLPDILLSRKCSTWITYGGGHFFWMIGSGVSCLLFGYLSRVFSPAKIILYCYIGAFVSFIFLMTVTNIQEPLLLATLFTLGLLLGGLNPLSIALGVSHVPNNRGMVSAFLMGFVWLVSEGLGIGLSGILANLFEQDGPTKSLLAIGFASFVVGIFFSFRLVAHKEEKVTENMVA